MRYPGSSKTTHTSQLFPVLLITEQIWSCPCRVNMMQLSSRKVDVLRLIVLYRHLAVGIYREYHALNSSNIISEKRVRGLCKYFDMIMHVIFIRYTSCVPNAADESYPLINCVIAWNHKLLSCWRRRTRQAVLYSFVKIKTMPQLLIYP